MSNILRANVVPGSRRNGFLLNFKGYLFAKNRVRGSKVYWRCTYAPCSAFIQTSVVTLAVGNQADVISAPPNHRHAPPGDDYNERMRVTSEMISVVQVSYVLSALFSGHNHSVA